MNEKMLKLTKFLKTCVCVCVCVISIGLLQSVSQDLQSLMLSFSLIAKWHTWNVISYTSYGTSTSTRVINHLSFPNFPGGSEVKASASSAGNPGSIPGLEDPLEKEMATHSSILAWKIPWTEEPGGLELLGYKESDTHMHTKL